MKAYSMDLRKRVLADCDAGLEVRQVGVKYDVSESWIRRLRQRRRENNDAARTTRLPPASGGRGNRSGWPSKISSSTSSQPSRTRRWVS